MEFFTILPMWNYSSKQIAIMNSERMKVGFIRRTYRGLWNKLIHYSPITLSFLETINIDGENNDQQIKIREQSFKSNLTKLKWDVHFRSTDTEMKALLVDQTKISTNPRMVYHKNSNEYLFKIDLFNRTCKVSSGDHLCATIKIEKKFPLSLRTVIETNDLTVVELLSIYYVITLVY